MANRKPRKPVKNHREINQLKAEKVAYRNPVEGVHCLYVKVTPSGDKVFLTAASVSKRIKLPTGAQKQRSIVHGSVASFSWADIKRVHYEAYAAFKRGEDPRIELKREVSDLERTTLLNRPIVELSYERIERKRDLSEITANSEYNDRLYTAKVKAVIGQVSFQEFGQRHADALAKAYPSADQWTTADKVKKLIVKVYNDLTSDARIALQKDIPHYLNKAFGRIKPVKRADQLVNPQDIGEMWIRMLDADVNPIFKDAWVFMLLTGERRSASLKAQLKNVRVDNGAPEFLFVEGKGDRDGPGANVIPTFGILALLISRLMDASDALGSQYLFPSQKGTGSLTSIKPLINAIGYIGDNEKRTNPHNLRRTIANLAIEVLGSKQQAEEQVLHFKSHMTGSTANYFSPESLSFAKLRSESYRKIYRHLDDLILWSGKLGYVDRETAPMIDLKEDQLTNGWLCRSYLSLGTNRNFWFNRGGGIKELGIFKDHDDFDKNAKVWSPVASFCSGTDQFVHINNRPLFRDRLLNEWANFGERRERDLQDEID